MNMKLFNPLALCLVLLISCGKSSRPPEQMSLVRPLESRVERPYQALLLPVNEKVSGHVEGSLTILREKDDLIADVRFSGGPASSIHPQNIHLGNRCPNSGDDLNGDGYIDGAESAKVFNKIIIPLDDDLSSQWMGLGTFPRSDEFGYYFWSRITPFKRLIDDLHENDINVMDDFVKIRSHEGLILEGRIIVITGVPETTLLPDTVQSYGRMTNHESLPVACGVIKELMTTPGIIDNDSTSIPLPGEQDPGSINREDDGASFPSNDIENTNYGEDEEPIANGHN